MHKFRPWRCSCIYVVEKAKYIGNCFCRYGSILHQNNRWKRSQVSAGRLLWGSKMPIRVTTRLQEAKRFQGNLKLNRWTSLVSDILTCRPAYKFVMLRFNAFPSTL